MKELKWWMAGLLFIALFLFGCFSLVLWIRANVMLAYAAFLLGLSARMFNWLRANNK